MPTRTVQQLRRTAQSKQLNVHAINQFLCHLLSCSPTKLYAYPEQVLNPTQMAQFTLYINQYCAGKPLAQIIKHCEFFSLQFEISPQVLIPRPETELLVNAILRYLKPKATILELGVGCGAISIALAKNYPQIDKIVATDIQHDALHLAQKNAARHNIRSIEFLHGDWFGAIEPRQSFDMIVSNPPYVATEDAYLDRDVATYEPATALFAGKEGLEHLQTIIARAPDYLKESGTLLVEHSALQQTAVANLMMRSGLSQIHCYKDMAQLPRATKGRLT